MKKSLLLLTSMMFLACSATFAQQEEKSAHVQKQVKEETNATPVQSEKVQRTEASKLKKKLVNKEAEELKTVNLKAKSVREEKIED
tara:strand:- start:9 stop:266 length:258 start_codon:yes stop_codon:yes gene_type:complete